MTTLFVDVESYNEVPITVGTARYAETAELMVISWAVDDGPIEVIDLTSKSASTVAFMHAWHGVDLVVAHNVPFDRTMLAAKGIERPLSQWHCTQAQALAHSLPGALGKLSEIYSLGDSAKDKAGRALIQLFCKPRPKTSKIRRATRDTHPVEWQQFLDYAGQDIVAMRELYKKLPRWNLTAVERTGWEQHMAISERGFFTDRQLAEQAVELGVRAKEALQERTEEITGTDLSVTQRDALLAHILKEYGVSLPDMQAATLERRIQDEDLPEPVRELLEIRLFSSKGSNAKWQVLLNSVSKDGRLRFTSKWCGANRAGRISGSGFQPLNMPRPPKKLKKLIPEGIQAIKAGIADLIYDAPLDMASACLRGAIIAPPGKKLLVADINGVQDRLTAWYADETWVLDAYRDYDAGRGPDVYMTTYARLFTKTLEEVIAENEAGGNWRNVGKVIRLSGGFGGGVAAVQKMARLYGVVMTDAETKAIVDKYRGGSPRTSTFWYELEEACKGIITSPSGTARELGKLVIKKSGSWLRIVLPSGRSLSYASPQIEPGKYGDGQITYAGTNEYTKQWGRAKTWGGKLTQNIALGTERDILVANLQIIEKAGYNPVFSCYDEAVGEVPNTDDYTVKELVRMLSTVPDWAPGLPLAANGFETDRYRKD